MEDLLKFVVIKLPVGLFIIVKLFIPGLTVGLVRLLIELLGLRDRVFEGNLLAECITTFLWFNIWLEFRGVLI